ncbi:hypothetical protein BDB00DRAFT_837937 [Zychaea mexicana]|uniref:uncharacterized protein n=1 Tax=Zychaea mexicana TaxID=64656 RepID=UPI0022FF059E|nr:uncharacterized protein BDB00DRAFT_837937 [Zychaea mexicana]KAI9490471.1 hypothetical protein BDB00DRAFT_837937 [Zychaea mexicana]
METQSLWRREHYLFDVHNPAWHTSAQGTTGILLPNNNANNCAPQYALFDHGLIYHHHSNEKSLSNTNSNHHDRHYDTKPTPTATTPSCYSSSSFSRELDVFGSSVLFCQPRVKTTFNEDPFRLAAAQREAQREAAKRACSSSSYLVESDPSKRQRTTTTTTTTPSGLS